MKSIAIPILLLSLLCLVGCGTTKVNPNYGITTLDQGKHSPGGFSELRKYIGEQKSKTYTLKQLSDQAKRLDAIVWIPQDIGCPSTSAVEWFETWLSEKSNRTLVYIGRDYSPIAEYLRVAIQSATPEGKAEYQRQLALEQTNGFRWFESVEYSSEQPWFYYIHREQPISYMKTEGPWSEQWKIPTYLQDGPAPKTSSEKRAFRKILKEEKIRKEKLEKIGQRTGKVTTPPTPSGNAGAGNTKTTNSPPSNSAASDSSDDGIDMEDDVDDEDADEDEEDTSNGSPAVNPSISPPSSPPRIPPLRNRSRARRNGTIPPPWATPPAPTPPPPTNNNRYDYNVLLKTSSGEALVFEVTLPDWNGSKIIVFANGSSLCNLGLVRSGEMEIASTLIDNMPLKKSVGFLESMNSPSFRNDIGEEKSLKGFELLTEWPLNLISFHAIILAILTLIAVFPIFGRGQSLRGRSTKDFGQHIEALGNMLRYSKDRSFALLAISDYFRIARREPTSQWVLTSEPQAEPPNATMPAAISNPNTPLSLQKTPSSIFDKSDELNPLPSDTQEKQS